MNYFVTLQQKSPKNVTKLKIFRLVMLLFLASLSAQAQKQEIRAVWLTTVKSLDWPNSKNPQKQREELCLMLDRLRQAGINTVLMQTRVRATTIYPSKLEPWDVGVAGAYGRSPGYDVLRFAIDECHKRGMQLHAWVVTLPVGQWNAGGCKALRQKHPKLVRKFGDEGFMNPEAPGTADYLAEVCREIVQNYDVDGLHLDYIRYPDPWPKTKKAAERQQRRQHITRIVSAIHQAVKQAKPWVIFSCSPVGKHSDLSRYSSSGWNARDAVCQDAQAWLRDGLMDALYPMMYFRGNHFFPFLLDWKERSYGRFIVPGLGIYFLDPKEGPWPLDEVVRQLNVCRNEGLGHCYFRVRFLLDNHKGVLDFAQQFDALPALIPPMTWYGTQAPTAPASLKAADGRLTWGEADDPSGAPYLLYNIYASADDPVDTSNPQNLIATRLTKTSIALPSPSLNYAVTAQNRYGQEGPARQLLLNAGPRYFAPVIARADGQYISLPPKDKGLDAEFVVVETMQGLPVAVLPYPADALDISTIPNGIYQVRSLGRKGITHRLGFFSIKR